MKVKLQIIMKLYTKLKEVYNLNDLENANIQNAKRFKEFPLDSLMDKKMKVGYLGPKGTFSYEICNNVYSNKYEKIPFWTILDLIKALENCIIDEAIVPIENSLQGCVTEAIDTIIKSNNISIYAEEILKINQNLMAKKKYKLNEIKQVYSHPQAIAQCRGYLQKNLQQAELIEVSSTALSAKKVAQKDNTACICNISCRKEYNLEVLDKDIQDNNFNETKFWRLINYNKEVVDADKMTLVFGTEDKPGALFKALRIFETNSLNLTKIESRPTKKQLGQYYFWIDVDLNNNVYEKAIKELEKEVIDLKVLGKYKSNIKGEKNDI